MFWGEKKMDATDIMMDGAWDNVLGVEDLGATIEDSATGDFGAISIAIAAVAIGLVLL